MLSNYKLSTLTFLILGIILLNSCQQNKEIAIDEGVKPIADTSLVELTDAQFKNANLQMSLPEKTVLGHIINLNGKIEVMPENNITVSTPMNGFVRQIKWMPGMKVNKGQVLVRLEEKEYIQLQQDYLSAKNGLKFAKMDYQRQSELSTNQAVSEKIVQQADEKVKEYQILLKSLGEKLKLIHINPTTLTADNITSQIVIASPVSGTIADVWVNTGQYVHVGDALLNMIDNKGTKMVLKAFEKDIPYLETGQKIVAYANGQPNKKMNGKIDFIGNKIEDEGFVRIICSIDSRHSELIPGMYMNAEIEAQSTETWTVPEEAIVNFEGKEYIFVEKGDKSYEMQEIKPGQFENGRIQILNFPNIEEKKIVTQGAYTLLMKMKNVEE